MNRNPLPFSLLPALLPALLAALLPPLAAQDSGDDRRPSQQLRVDLKITAMSSIDLTVSVGAGVVVEQGRDARREIMASPPGGGTGRRRSA